MLMFAHGFAVRFNWIVPPKDVDVVLYVPNAPGAFVRSKYQKGEGVYGCVSVDQTFGARETELRSGDAITFTMEKGLDGALAPLAGLPRAVHLAAWITMTVTVTVVLSVIAWYGVERPFLRLKTRFPSVVATLVSGP